MQLTKTPERISNGQSPSTSKVLNVGVIGYGYWGPNLVRNLQELETTEVSMISDLSMSRLDQAHRSYPNVALTTDYDELLASDVDAVVVATPISTHFRVGRDCLRAGKHVLIEKPLATTTAEGEELIELAHRSDRTLMVGHTFEYNPAVEMLKEIIDSGEIGDVYYIYASRTNLGIFQKDVNVLWDLAPHDLSILMFLLGLEPTEVSVTGGDYVQPGIHDVARMTLNFPNRIQAHVHVSWLDPCKVRRLTVVGDEKMVVYDDVEPLEKIKIYDKGVDKPEYTDTYGEFQLSYRYGDITTPMVPPHEPLKVECANFAESILNGERPRSHGEVGLKVVKILESADQSLANGGARCPIAW